MKNSQKKNSKKNRWFIQALVLSGLLNIVFILIFFFFIIKDRPITSTFDYKPINSSLNQLSEPLFNAQFILSFQSMNYSQLVEKLKATQLIEDGYTERDIALACLVKEHFFDIKRALNGKMVQERELFYQIGMEKKAIPVYAGLIERDYQAILTFVLTEKWPFTSQGLFFHLKQGNRDSTLTQSFCQTPEFLTVETLFGRSGIPIKKRVLLDLLSEGSWLSLSQLIQAQKISQDFSQARRQCFLLDYIGQKSRTAAYLLIMTDRLFTEKRLDDEQVCRILELLNEKTSEAELFAKELLASPRSDSVRQLAAKRLYDYAGEKMPENPDYKVALAKFCPENIERHKQLAQEKASQKMAEQEMLTSFSRDFTFAQKEELEQENKQTAKNVGTGNLRPKFRDKPPASPAPRIHIIQEGESLWMISRKYKVDLETLMRYNGLKSNLIKPGKTLKIPPILNPA